MPKPIRLSHAVLKSHNVERLRSWYCEALDAHVVFEQLPQLSFITYDEEHHRLGIALPPGNPEKLERAPAGAPGLMHLAFTYASLRDLLSVYERLGTSGTKPVFAVNHGPTVSLYYNDPDGNGVEFLVDRFADAKGAQDFIDEVFDRNPVGIAFDPDRALRQLREGVSEEQIMFYDKTLPMVDTPYI